MSKRKRELSQDEKDLWRRVAATTKPRRRAETAALPEAPASAAKGPRAQPVRQQTIPSKPQRLAPPQDRSAEKRVRRGALTIDATLDLHGHSQDSARAALLRFLQRAHARGDRLVIVVTGVGRGGEGVLKRRLPDWLAEAGARSLVSGFAPAHRTHGGAGAFYVFLRRPR